MHSCAATILQVVAEVTGLPLASSSRATIFAVHRWSIGGDVVVGRPDIGVEGDEKLLTEAEPG